ncbi:MAG TPA: purine-nucleoside phosphorylase, partial [Bryobacteraceae bacterium]
AARQFLETALPARPQIAVILGSGLGAFAEELAGATSIPYSDIPDWPRSTAIGHAGRLVAGKIGDVDVAVLSGRVHLYEGYTAQQVTFGIRVLGLLGIKSLVVTNAAGGIGSHLGRGGVVLISDHINLQGANPLIGPNDEALGARFPDMTEAYSKAYRETARKIAGQLGYTLQEGIYAALTGPSYETPAEIRYLRTIGADLVGMSTVPEVIVANHMGIKVLGISVVTNLAAGISQEKLTHKEVLETGEQVRGMLVQFLKALLPRLGGTA